MWWRGQKNGVKTGGTKPTEEVHGQALCPDHTCLKRNNDTKYEVKLFAQVMGTPTSSDPMLGMKHPYNSRFDPWRFRNKKDQGNSNLNVSLAGAYASVLKETAKIHLTGEFISCLAYYRTKGKQACTPHRTTRRTTRPLNLVHIYTSGRHPASHGGLQYVMMFVNSPSRLQRPNGSRLKSTSAIRVIVKCFVA